MQDIHMQTMTSLKLCVMYAYYRAHFNSIFNSHQIILIHYFHLFWSFPPNFHSCLDFYSCLPFFWAGENSHQIWTTNSWYWYFNRNTVWAYNKAVNIPEILCFVKYEYTEASTWSHNEFFTTSKHTTVLNLGHAFTCTCSCTCSLLKESPVLFLVYRYCVFMVRVM